MAFIYLNMNGDNVGSNIGSAVASDNESGVGDMSGRLKQAHQAFEAWVTQAGGQVIVSSGDESLCKVPAEAFDESAVEELRQQYEQTTGHTATLGIGNSMSEAAKALIYGKLNEKNQTIVYEPAIEDYIAGDSEASQEVEEIVEEEQQAEQSGSDENGQVEETFIPEDGDSLDNDGVEAGQSPDESPEATMPDQMEQGNENLMEEGEMSEEDAAVDPEQKIDEFVGADVDGDGNIDEMAPVGDEDGDGDIDDEDSESMISDMVHANMEGSEDDMGEEQPEEVEELGAHEVEGGFEDEQPEMQEQGAGDDDIKQEIMSALSAFKENKDMLEQAREQNPALYGATISMLRSMIEMAKRFNVNPAPELEENAEEMMEEGEEIPMEDSEEEAPFLDEEDSEEPQEESEESFEESESAEDDSEEESEEEEKKVEKSEKGVHNNYQDKGVSSAGHDVRFGKKPEHGMYGIASNKTIARQGKEKHKKVLAEQKAMKKPNLPKSEEAMQKDEKGVHSEISSAVNQGKSLFGQKARALKQAKKIGMPNKEREIKQDAKRIHQDVMSNIPKPNLPKSEEAMKGVNRTSKLTPSEGGKKTDSEIGSIVRDANEYKKNPKTKHLAERNIEGAKHFRKENIKEQKAMKKPSLPKSEQDKKDLVKSRIEEGKTLSAEDHNRTAHVYEKNAHKQTTAEDYQKYKKQAEYHREQAKKNLTEKK